MVFTSGYCIAKLQATRANSKADRLGVGKVKCRPAFGSTAQKTFAVPSRSYSLSRRASRPGCAGEAGRTSACSVTGFSSRHHWLSGIVRFLVRRQNVFHLGDVFLIESGHAPHF